MKTAQKVLPEFYSKSTIGVKNLCLISFFSSGYYRLVNFSPSEHNFSSIKRSPGPRARSGRAGRGRWGSRARPVRSAGPRFRPRFRPRRRRHAHREVLLLLGAHLPGTRRHVRAQRLQGTARPPPAPRSRPLPAAPCAGPACAGGPQRGSVSPAAPHAGRSQPEPLSRAAVRTHRPALCAGRSPASAAQSTVLRTEVGGFIKSWSQ